MEGSRGYIVPVGGAEEKIGDVVILRRFATLCGTHGCRIAIIPTASELSDTGHRYEELFRSLGVAEARSLPIASRADCERREWLDVLDEVDGVFLTGGNQLRLSTMIGGTEVAKALRRRNSEGMHVAGTSAGAAFLCEHMIAFGREGASPRARIVTLAPGLGLTNKVIIDQHFRQRDRIGRLLALVAGSPELLGIGIDEDTAALFSGDTLEVLGRHSVTIVDGSGAETDIHRVKGHGAITVSGAVLHVLSAGNRFDLVERKLLPNEAWSRKAEAARRR